MKKIFIKQSAFSFLTLFFVLSTQNIKAQTKNADSCNFFSTGYIAPGCRIDTCRAWTLMLSSCDFTSYHLKVFNADKTKIIFEGDNKMWGGGAKETKKLCPAGFYPFEVVFFLKNGGTFKKESIVYLYELKKN